MRYPLLDSLFDCIFWCNLFIDYCFVIVIVIVFILGGGGGGRGGFEAFI